jgi:hypothetical protein
LSFLNRKEGLGNRRTYRKSMRRTLPGTNSGRRRRRQKCLPQNAERTMHSRSNFCRAGIWGTSPRILAMDIAFGGGVREAVVASGVGEGGDEIGSVHRQGCRCCHVPWLLWRGVSSSLAWTPQTRLPSPVAYLASWRQRVPRRESDLPSALMFVGLVALVADIGWGARIFFFSFQHRLYLVH